jgi:hypothetical protein
LLDLDMREREALIAERDALLALPTDRKAQKATADELTQVRTAVNTDRTTLGCPDRAGGHVGASTRCTPTTPRT